jgi:hypothetical protein
MNLRRELALRAGARRAAFRPAAGDRIATREDGLDFAWQKGFG